MRIIGITGGVGAGKSEVLEYISEEFDAFVIQLDEVGYLLMCPGGACYAPILKLFGTDITNEDGAIDRKRLAEIVFADKALRDQLNAIVHPAVKKYVRKSIDRERLLGTEFFFIEGALLIEDHYDEICDEMWFVYAGNRTRRKRLKEGRGYSDEKIDQIIAAQLSVEEFHKHCNFEVYNNRDFEYTREQIAQRMKQYETV